MRRTLIIALAVLLGAPAPGPAAAAAAADGGQTLDDFLESPERARDVKLLGLVIVSQTDPEVAESNTTELRRSYWAARPGAGLSAEAAEAELARWDAAWDDVVEVVRQRKITTISFAGIDDVLLKKSQDWYYAAITPRGPVLIRLSVQFNLEGPMTLHGVRVWTKWDEVKAVTAAIHLKPGTKVASVTYNRKRKSTGADGDGGGGGDDPREPGERSASPPEDAKTPR